MTESRNAVLLAALSAELDRVAADGGDVPPYWHIGCNSDGSPAVWLVGPIDGDLDNDDDSNIYSTAIDKGHSPDVYHITVIDAVGRPVNVAFCTGVAELVWECWRLWADAFGRGVVR